MTHKLTVKYKSELLRGVELPEGWVCGKHADGTWWASGKCPKCGGDAYGPTLPSLAESGVEQLPSTATDADRQLVAEVRADCRCGDDHGEKDKKSCGRYWVVECFEDVRGD